MLVLSSSAGCVRLGLVRGVEGPLVYIEGVRHVVVGDKRQVVITCDRWSVCALAIAAVDVIDTLHLNGRTLLQVLGFRCSSLDTESIRGLAGNVMLDRDLYCLVAKLTINAHSIPNQVLTSIVDIFMCTVLRLVLDHDGLTRTSRGLIQGLQG